jgi:Peptidase family M41
MRKASRQYALHEHIAYHEAGHVVMARLQHIRFDFVSIARETDGSAGRVVYPERDDSTDSRGRRHRDLLVVCAGTAAEMLHAGSYVFTGAAGDIQRAAEIASGEYLEPDECAASINLTWIQARNLLAEDRHWHAVGRIAESLMERQGFGYRYARKTISSAIQEYERQPNQYQYDLLTC